MLNWPSEGQFTISRAMNTECEAHCGTLAGAQRSARQLLLPLIALLSTWLFIYHCVMHYTFFTRVRKIAKSDY
jgi:hypothetical protein